MRNREVFKISLIFIGLSVALSVLAISFEIAPQKEPEVRNTQIKVTTDSVAITTESFDVSGVYSVVAIVKDSNGKEVKRLVLARGQKLPDNFYIYKSSFLKKELLYGEYSMDIVATDWLGYKEEKFNQGAVEIIKLLDSTVFYLIDQKGNKDGILNMADYTEEVKNAEGLIAAYGGEAKVIFKTIESYEGTRVKLGEFKCPDFDRNNILNIFDLAKIGITFGTREGEPRYNPDYDINNDKIIDASDLSIIVLYLNQVPTDFPVCIPIAENQKDLSKYSLKEVFLISDQNWQDVLSLVPVTTWTDNQKIIHKYPTLIYHREGDAFDADSILYFLEQYSAQKLTSIGDLPSELIGLINGQNLVPYIINPNDHLSYWNSFKDVVYVENNYELALLASTYASLINAPLIIQGTSLDSFGVFYGRNVTLVGNVSCPIGATCDEKYTLDQLQQKYVKETKTDKIILVNPNDLDIKVTGEFTPQKSSGPISELYSKTSLAAPILASAKHEIILSSRSKIVDEVDRLIEEKAKEWGIKKGYLTVLATPDAIENEDFYYIGSIPFKRTADLAKYIFIDQDKIPDLAVGRIFGVTVADVSSYVNRAVFYPLLPKEKNILTIASDAFPFVGEALAYKDVFGALGYGSTSIIEEHNMTPNAWPKDYRNKALVYYSDHAGTRGFGGLSAHNLPNLSNTFMIIIGCSTCVYHDDSSYYLACAQALRKGAIGYIGMFTGGGADFGQFFISAIFQNQPIGKAFIGAVVPMSSYIRFPPTIGWMLIGDPTLTLDFPYSFPGSSLRQLDPETYEFELRVAEMDSKFTLYKGGIAYLTDYKTPVFSGADRLENIFTQNSLIYYYETKKVQKDLYAFVRVGPVERSFSYNISSEGIGSIALFDEEIIDEQYKYLWLEFHWFTWDLEKVIIPQTTELFESIKFHFKVVKK